MAMPRHDNAVAFAVVGPSTTLVDTSEIVAVNDVRLKKIMFVKNILICPIKAARFLTRPVADVGGYLPGGYVGPDEPVGGGG